MKQTDDGKTLYDWFSTEEDYLEMLEAAVETSGIGILIADANGVVLKVNQAQVDITGQEASTNVGRNMRDVQIDDQSPSATVMVCNTLKPVKIEQNLVNGRSYLVYASPYFGEDGNLKYVVSNLLDTTEINKTKQSLEKIKEDHDRLSIQLLELQNQMHPESKIIHHSRIMRQMLLLCEKAAQFDSNILIHGESGVGKEKVAGYIFEKSKRNTKPFVKINCASIPENLLESELFGYEAGSFTNANPKGKKGILESADEGTLLLDEISELAMPLQAKLLRFLQEKEFYRIGGIKPVSADVRIIAASNKELETLVQNGSFREDLFHRLNVIPIFVPPLRERKEDIPLLIGYFVNKFNEKHNLKKSFDLSAVNALTQFQFPGNVRELQNTIERILVLSERDVILERDINKFLKGIDKPVDSAKVMSLKELTSQFEENLLRGYLEKYKTQEKLSEVLKVSQSTISRKLERYHITI